MNYRTFKIISTGALMLSATSTIQSAELFVSPNGKDSNSGSKQKPLQTLAEAKQRVSKSGKLGKEPITISLLPGTYYLKETLMLGSEDSGTETTPFLPHVFRPNSFFTDFPPKANS